MNQFSPATDRVKTTSSGLGRKVKTGKKTKLSPWGEILKKRAEARERDRITQQFIVNNPKTLLLQRRIKQREELRALGRIPRRKHKLTPIERAIGATKPFHWVARFSNPEAAKMGKRARNTSNWFSQAWDRDAERDKDTKPILTLPFPPVYQVVLHMLGEGPVTLDEVDWNDDMDSLRQNYAKFKKFHENIDREDRPLERSICKE